MEVGEEGGEFQSFGKHVEYPELSRFSLLRQFSIRRKKYKNNQMSNEGANNNTTVAKNGKNHAITVRIHCKYVSDAELEKMMKMEKFSPMVDDIRLQLRKQRLAKVKGGAVQMRSGYYLPRFGCPAYRTDDIFKDVAFALECGCRLFDTSLVDGDPNELGKALTVLLPKYNLTRKDIFITIKFNLPTFVHPDLVQTNVKDSLWFLGTSYFDLAILQAPSAIGLFPADPQNATLRKKAYQTLEDLKEKGVIRSIGVCYYEVQHLIEIKQYCKKMPDVCQAECHPHLTRPFLRKYCQQEGIVFQALHSLANRRHSLLKDSLLQRLGKKYGTSEEMILWAWALRKGMCIIPMGDLRSSNYDEIDNICKLKNKLTIEDCAAISTLDDRDSCLSNWWLTDSERYRLKHTVVPIGPDFHCSLCGRNMDSSIHYKCSLK